MTSFVSATIERCRNYDRAGTLAGPENVRWAMRTLDGVVTVVQESRFFLQTGQGEHHLFILAHNAAAEPAQLAPLQHRQARVRVRYESAPDLIAFVAHSVTLLEGEEAAR